MINLKSKCKIKKTLLLSVLISFMACTNKYCNDIVEFIDNNYIESNETNIIDLKNHYKFEWDEIRIFESFHTPADISESLGFDCNCDAIYDGESLFLFIKDNKIIKKDTGECKNLSFLDISNGGLTIEKNKSSFFINKIEEESKILFTLKKIVE